MRPEAPDWQFDYVRSLEFEPVYSVPSERRYNEECSVLKRRQMSQRHDYMPDSNLCQANTDRLVGIEFSAEL
jgi:hypothetical protein